MDDDVLEAAKTSRSRCRQCRKEIEEGDLRFGSTTEGFYGDSMSTSWFHPRCAAQRMPERLLPLLRKIPKSQQDDDWDDLVLACDKSAKKNASKYPYGDRAPTGRARCMKCEQAIEKDVFRIAIERQIQAGAFAQTGAGYLHPACAVAHLEEPALGSIVRNNSPLLSSKDLDELAALCDAAAPKTKPAAKKETSAKLTQKVVKHTKTGEELVLADQLIEKGDVRGELIVAAADLHEVGMDDPRGPALAARIKELTPAAHKRWATELKIPVTRFTLEHGLPSRVRINLGKKKDIPEHEWITGYLITNGTEKALAEFLKRPSFKRVRHLVTQQVDFSWDGFRGFCSCDEVKTLESLELNINVGARGFHMLLTATKFERLSKLTISTGYQLEPDLRGFDGVAGLAALRSLELGWGTADAFEKVLQSPLVNRLEELRTLAWSWPKDVPALPNLRRLGFTGPTILPNGAKALATSKGLQNVRYLDLSAGVITSATVKHFADKKAIPSLTTLNVSKNQLDASTLKLLRERFGDRLLADDMVKPTRPEAPTKKKAAAKKTTAKKTKAAAKKTAKKKAAAKK